MGKGLESFVGEGGHRLTTTNTYIYAHPLTGSRDEQKKNEVFPTSQLLVARARRDA